MSGVREVAKNAGKKFRDLTSFEADQVITAGGLRIKAHVKFRKPRSIVLEYEEYRDPIEDFQVEVSGGSELIGEDLVGSKILFQGSKTWIHLADKNTAIEKDGKRLFSPFAGVDLVGQLGFLPYLMSDFLLKDEGEGEINERPVDRLGLKPKVERRSLFLKEEVFNLDRAELALDRELGLPLKITYYPGQGEQLRFSSSQGGPVFVEYSDYEVNGLEKSDFSFDPSKVDRVFSEKTLSEEEFEESFPLSVPLSELEDRGFERARDRISIHENEDTGRAYGSLVFVKSDEAGGRPTSSVQLLAGNYLSREMSRHNKFLSENGEEVELEGLSAQIADRAEKVRSSLPEDWDQDIYEVGWKDGDSFYFVLGQGVEREELLEIARIIC